MRYLQILSIVIPTGYSWGSDGHNIIVSWARGLMTEKGRKFLETHVGVSNDDLYTAATWADTLPALAKYPQSESHHFSHTPYRDCQEFKMERDCGFPGSEGECIVTGLADAIELAMDTTASSEQRQDAVKFILHFMGDIHQPLHVGFREDFGGNAIKVNGGKTLHEFWDNELINNYKSSIGGSKNWKTIAEKHRKGFNEDLIKRMRTSHDMKTVVSSSSDMIEYAAWLASDTAVTSTCKFAYSIQADRWIENGDILTTQYIESRIPVMIMALSKAAVRLAQLIDGISISLEDTKNSPPTLNTIRREGKLFGTKISQDPTYNIFVFLRFGTDHIEPPTEPECVDDELKGSGKKIETEPSSRKKKRSNKKKKKDKELEVLEQHEFEMRNTFEGIYLPSICLIDSDGTGVISSCLKSKIRGYHAPSVIPFRVMIDRTGTMEPKLYFFDSSVFKYDMSTELAVRCILKISGVKVDGVSNVDRYWTPSAAGTTSVKKETSKPAVTNDVKLGAPHEDLNLLARYVEEKKRRSNEHRKLCKNQHIAETQARFEIWKKSKLLESKSKGSVSEPLALADMWREDIEAKKSQIAVFKVENVVAFVLEETLRKPAYKLRFTYFTLYTQTHKTAWIIDTEIFEGILDKKLFDVLKCITASNISFSDSLIDIRPTWMTELRDINIALIGQEPDRLNSMQAIRVVVLYPGDGYTIIEWATFDAPVNVFDPPGWDETAILNQLIREEMESSRVERKP